MYAAIFTLKFKLLLANTALVEHSYVPCVTVIRRKLKLYFIAIDNLDYKSF
jgi:hypothetical protein